MELVEAHEKPVPGWRGRVEQRRVPFQVEGPEGPWPLNGHPLPLPGWAGDSGSEQRKLCCFALS